MRTQLNVQKRAREKPTKNEKWGEVDSWQKGNEEGDEWRRDYWSEEFVQLGIFDDNFRVVS